MDDFAIARIRPPLNLAVTLRCACTIVNFSIYAVVLWQLLALPLRAGLLEFAIIASTPALLTRGPGGASRAAPSAARLPPRRSAAICALASPAFGCAGTALSAALVRAGLSAGAARAAWLAWVGAVAGLTAVRVALNARRTVTVYRWDQCLPNVDDG